MTERPGGPPHPAGRAEFIAGKHVSRLLRQCLLGLLLMLLCCLPLSIWTPANQLPQPVLPIVNAVAAAGICLALSLRLQHRRKALYVSTASLLAVSTTSLLAFGLRYSGAALLALVAPILLLGLEHRRRGVVLATALGLCAVALSAGLELACSPRVQGRVSSELVSMLCRRGAFAAVTLGGVGFLVDRFLAILRDREEFLAGVFTNLETAVMVYDLDPSGNSYLAAMNKASEQVFGVSGAQVIGRSRRELLKSLAGRTLATKGSQYRQLGDENTGELARPQVSSGEIRLRVGDHEREFRVATTPILDESGAVVRMMVSGTDISAYRQAERQLRFQSDVLTSINDAVIAIDPAGKITYMNRAAERLYMQPAERCIGTTLTSLCGESFNRAVQSAARSPSDLSEVGSGQFARSDLIQVPVEFTVSTLHGEGDQPIGTLAVIRDVTERRQLQEQLVQAQKQEALGRLAGGVAHDFNNLLVVIRGSAEFVRADLPPQHASQPDLLEVMRAADRAAGLVRQLLAFARRQPPSPRSVNLDQVLHDLAYMLRRLIREEIELQVDIEPALWSVQVDVAQIEQVIVNLLVNARDAIVAAGHIKIQARNTMVLGGEARALGVTPGEYVLLKVRDNGVGMTAETMKHIFEPFFSTKVMGAGTGLGLAVCYGIIKQLGGGIVAQSAPGQGAEFTIALPRSHDPARSPTAPRSLELPRGTETVLIVEDDQSVRDLAVRVLRTQGYKVYEAADGASALARVEELGDEPLDLLFTDVILPQMRGQELAQCLMERRPGLTVLMASGYGDSGLSPVAIEDGVQAWLAKPYGPAALLQRVREVLDAAQRARGAQKNGPSSKPDLA
ncbi:MAG TPA: PAS domain-containing protein [Pseudomonadota bacterium]|nr:PAS domain-containing protein [Pseudomonadota bacterium]